MMNRKTIMLLSTLMYRIAGGNDEIYFYRFNCPNTWKGACFLGNVP